MRRDVRRGNALAGLRYLAHVVHLSIVRVAHSVLKYFPKRVLIGRRPEGFFHAAEPGVNHCPVVGDPMLTTLGASGFSPLIAGGHGGSHGKGGDRKCDRGSVPIRTRFMELLLFFES